MPEPTEGGAGAGGTGTEPSTAQQATSQLMGEINLGDRKVKVEDVLKWEKSSTDYEHLNKEFTQKSQKLSELEKTWESTQAGRELQALMDANPEFAARVIEVAEQLKAGGKTTTEGDGKTNQGTDQNTGDDLKARVDKMEAERQKEIEDRNVQEAMTTLNKEISEAQKSFSMFDEDGKMVLLAALARNPSIDVKKFAETYHKKQEGKRDQYLKEYWEKKGQKGGIPAGSGAAAAGSAGGSGSGAKELTLGRDTSSAAAELLATLASQKSS